MIQISNIYLSIYLKRSQFALFRILDPEWSWDGVLCSENVCRKNEDEKATSLTLNLFLGLQGPIVLPLVGPSARKGFFSFSYFLLLLQSPPSPPSSSHSPSLLSRHPPAPPPSFQILGSKFNLADLPRTICSCFCSIVIVLTWFFDYPVSPMIIDQLSFCCLTFIAHVTLLQSQRKEKFFVWIGFFICTRIRAMWLWWNDIAISSIHKAKQSTL